MKLNKQEEKQDSWRNYSPEARYLFRQVGYKPWKQQSLKLTKKEQKLLKWLRGVKALKDTKNIETLIDAYKEYEFFETEQTWDDVTKELEQLKELGDK